MIHQYVSYYWAGVVYSIEQVVLQHLFFLAYTSYIFCLHWLNLDRMHNLNSFFNPDYAPILSK